nr:MAG TPA: Nuclease [Caudoviricetes sp.]
METTMTAASARKKMPCPTESDEQKTLFSWASMRTYWYPELNLMFHIPNGGKRSKAEAGRFRAEGVKSGVPDICLPVARCGYHGLFIELKRQHGNTTTKNQDTWLADLREQGYAAAVAYGWEQAAKIITDYMEEEYENK